MRSKKIFIQGMHCASCEKLLESEFQNVSGVRKATIDQKTDSADIFFEKKEPEFQELKKVAGKFGYTVFEKEPAKCWSDSHSKAPWQDWMNAVLIVLALLFLYRIFQNLGFFDVININNTAITYSVAFLIGLVASVSSCLAVVGAVVIAFSEKYRSDGKSFFEGAVRPNLFFQVGRLAAFFVLGGLLGTIGGEINISGNFIFIYAIIIAAVMAWLGLNVLGLLPSLSAVGIRMPKKLSASWDDLKRSEHKAAPFLLGGLTFFLPCGFTQSMQLFALASGSFWVGGLTLLIFALGTVPSLLVLGAAAAWTKKRGFAVFQKVAGTLILLFAVYTFNSGLLLKGVSTSVISSDKKSAEEKSNSPSGQGQQQREPQQIVAIKVTSRGFEPSVLKVKQGVPVKWVIDGVNVTGCTSTIIVPSYNISKKLKSGENIIEFTPKDKGSLAFSCGMGMVRGKFVVE